MTTSNSLILMNPARWFPQFTGAWYKIMISAEVPCDALGISTFLVYITPGLSKGFLKKLVQIGCAKLQIGSVVWQDIC